MHTNRGEARSQHLPVSLKLRLGKIKNQGKSFLPKPKSGLALALSRAQFNGQRPLLRDKMAKKHRRGSSGIAMIVSTSFVSAVFIVFSLAAADSALGNSPQQQLKTYALHNSPNSADISPDEQLVVTETTNKNDGADSGTKTFAEVVQIWKFKEDKLIAEFTAQRVQVKASSKNYFSDPVDGARIVRFSPDGSVVVALVDQTIHVLSATDLTELRTIPVAAPDTTRKIHGRTIISKPSIHAVEISPNGKVVAVLWVTEMLYGRIELYDLSSGRNQLSWETPQGWIHFTRELVRHPNGKLLLIAIPNETPCLSPGNEPDVFAFDAETGAIKHKLTSGLLTESIAVTADNRVLALDSNCLGVFKNHDPKLKVFDLVTGKHLLDVSGRGTGVRYLVSASADGSRFLAFTGKMKTKFDWGDFVPQDVIVDSTFSVWSLTNYQGIVTSQNIPGLSAWTLRLSSKGRYAVSSGKASFVYELP